MHNSYFSLKLNEKCCNRALPLLPSWLSLLPVPTGGRSHFSLNFESSLAPEVGNRQVVRYPGIGRQVDGWRSTITEYKIDRLAVERMAVYRSTGSMYRIANLSTADL